MNRNFEKAFYEKMGQKKYRVMLSVCSSMIRSILILVPTFLMRNIYNSLELGLDAKGVFAAILMTFVLPVIVAASYTLDIRMNKYIFIIIQEIRVWALENTIGQNLRAILAQNKSDLFNRMVVSLEELGEYYYYLINTSTWYITTTIAGIGMMLVINARITLVLLVFVVLQIGCSLVIQKQIERVKELENQLQAEGSDYVVRIMTHHAFLKTSLLCAQQLKEEKAWEQESFQVCKSGMLNSQIVAVLSFLLTLMRTLYLFFAVHALFLNHTILKGDFIALNSYIVWLTPVFLGLQESIEDLVKARANKRRVNAYLQENAAETVKAIVPDAPLQKMEVLQLSFAYEGAKRPLFTDQSFQVQSGETLFIVGDSGCGKSTLLNLLLGLEPAYDGAIFYNGLNLKELDVDWLHRNVILVGQDVDLLPTTLRENVLYSGAGVGEEEVVRVLRALKIDYLMQMPGALDWDMKKHPRALSDGEKKRIAIARALLAKPRALFLDEPTAGLDNINKIEVTRFIERSVDGLLVIVTHDRVFDEGARVLSFGRRGL